MWICFYHRTISLIFYFSRPARVLWKRHNAMRLTVWTENKLSASFPSIALSTYPGKPQQVSTYNERVFYTKNMNVAGYFDLAKTVIHDESCIPVNKKALSDGYSAWHSRQSINLSGFAYLPYFYWATIRSRVLMPYNSTVDDTNLQRSAILRLG